MRLAELIPVLQMAVGPVILISGVGLLILSMTNRFGRVIDRTRQAAEARRRAAEGDRARFAAQLEVLRKRGNLLRWAILLAVLSVLCAALLVIAIFITATLNSSLALPIIALFLASMLLLIGSLVAFVQDLNLSLEALNLEVAEPPAGAGTKRGE